MGNAHGDNNGFDNISAAAGTMKTIHGLSTEIITIKSANLISHNYMN